MSASPFCRQPWHPPLGWGKTGVLVMTPPESGLQPSMAQKKITARTGWRRVAAPAYTG